MTHLKQMKQRNILISVGEDEEGINPTIKVWNLDKMDRNKLPTCTRTIKVAADAGTTSPVSVIAALENLSQLAVGLANGVVVLYRGDISRDRFTKPKVVHRGQDPITGTPPRPLPSLRRGGPLTPVSSGRAPFLVRPGLGFREQGKTTYLYVVTPNYADAYVTSTLFGKETRVRRRAAAAAAAAAARPVLTLGVGQRLRSATLPTGAPGRNRLRLEVLRDQRAGRGPGARAHRGGLLLHARRPRPVLCL